MPTQQTWALFLPNRILISGASIGPAPGWVVSGPHQSQQSCSPVPKPNQRHAGGIKLKETKQDSPQGDAVADVVLSTLCSVCTPATCGRQWYYPHDTDEETEAQRASKTFSWQHS